MSERRRVWRTPVLLTLLALSGFAARAEEPPAPVGSFDCSRCLRAEGVTCAAAAAMPVAGVATVARLTVVAEACGDDGHGGCNGADFTAKVRLAVRPPHRPEARPQRRTAWIRYSSDGAETQRGGGMYLPPGRRFLVPVQSVGNDIYPRRPFLPYACPVPPGF